MSDAEALVDAHHHVWDLDVRPQPWLDEPGHEPIRRSFSSHALRSAAARTIAGRRLTSTVVVQCIASVPETRDLLALADSDPLIGAVVGWADLTSPAIGDDRVTPVEDATAAVDAAWDAGIRYFDTAPHYGLGLSERRLGAALRGRPRDEYVISSEVGRLLVPNEEPRGVDTWASSYGTTCAGRGTSAGTACSAPSRTRWSAPAWTASTSSTRTIRTTTGGRRPRRPCPRSRSCATRA